MRNLVEDAAVGLLIEEPVVKPNVKEAVILDPVRLVYLEVEAN